MYDILETEMMLDLICKHIKYAYLRAALLDIGMGKMSEGGRNCILSVKIRYVCGKP